MCIRDRCTVTELYYPSRCLLIEKEKEAYIISGNEKKLSYHARQVLKRFVRSIFHEQGFYSLHAAAIVEDVYKRQDKDHVVGLGNTKALAVGFFMLQYDGFAQALDDGMARLHNPEDFLVSGFTPFQIQSGGAAQLGENFGRCV